MGLAWDGRSAVPPYTPFGRLPFTFVCQYCDCLSGTINSMGNEMEPGGSMLFVIPQHIYAPSLSYLMTGTIKDAR